MEPELVVTGPDDAVRAAYKIMQRQIRCGDTVTIIEESDDGDLCFSIFSDTNRLLELWPILATVPVVCRLV